MPELPEVETIVRELVTSHLIGKQIHEAHVYWARIIEKYSAEEFCKHIRNQRIRSIERRGKYIVFQLSKDTLWVHLRMTGKFEFITKESLVNKHEHVRLIFNDGTILRYVDPRKFGRWSLLKDAAEKMNALGLEPLSKEFTLHNFTLLFHKHSSQIKPFLLNQKYIAGLGNIYVDESLWEAKIHPQRLTSSLTDSEIRNLYKSIQEVLKKAISNLGTSLGRGQGNYASLHGKRGGHQYHLKVHRQKDRECPRCKTAIVKSVVAQRGTYYCPKCQKI